MRILYKLTGTYNKIRWLMWLGGILTTTLVPLAGYGLHALGIARDKQELATDNPELASEESVGTLFDWLTSENVGKIIRITVILGIVYVIFLIILQIFSFLGVRTSVSGTDRATATKEANRNRADMDEMDMIEDGEDMDYQTPSINSKPQKAKKRKTKPVEDDEEDWFTD